MSGKWHQNIHQPKWCNSRTERQEHMVPTAWWMHDIITDGLTWPMQIHSEIPFLSLSLPERGLINLRESGRLPNTSVCGIGMRERERERGWIDSDFSILSFDGRDRWQSQDGEHVPECTCAGVADDKTKSFTCSHKHEDCAATVKLGSDSGVHSI